MGAVIDFGDAQKNWSTFKWWFSLRRNSFQAQPSENDICGPVLRFNGRLFLRDRGVGSSEPHPSSTNHSRCHTRHIMHGSRGCGCQERISVMWDGCVQGFHPHLAEQSLLGSQSAARRRVELWCRNTGM